MVSHRIRFAGAKNDLIETNSVHTIATYANIIDINLKINHIITLSFVFSGKIIDFDNANKTHPAVAIITPISRYQSFLVCCSTGFSFKF